MTIINVKIAGVEGDSVLVKYASENSSKSIDEYEAIAYQPKNMGYSSLDEFIEGIKPSLLSLVNARDAAEQSTLDLSSWINHESTHEVEEVLEVPAVEIPNPLESQVINVNSEVIL
jgi:hypothetical protein